LFTEFVTLLYAANYAEQCSLGSCLFPTFSIYIVNRQTVHRFGGYPLISDKQTTWLSKIRVAEKNSFVVIFLPQKVLYLNIYILENTYVERFPGNSSILSGKISGSLVTGHTVNLAVRKPCLIS